MFFYPLFAPFNSGTRNRDTLAWIIDSLRLPIKEKMATADKYSGQKNKKGGRKVRPYSLLRPAAIKV